MKNPLSYDKDITALTDELNKPIQNKKLIGKLYTKVYTKAFAQGALIGLAGVALTLLLATAYQAITGTTTEEDN